MADTSRQASAIAAEPTDEELAQDLARGRVSALDALMSRHARAVATLLDRTLRDRSWADDLAQETFARVFRRAATFRPGERFRPWLYSIALNLARDQNRRWALWRLFMKRSRPVEGAPAPPDSERAREVREALSELAPRFREALVLCELDGLSYEEAAQAAGTSPKTISSRLARARAKFRDAWLRRHPEEAR